MSTPEQKGDGATALAFLLGLGLPLALRLLGVVMPDFYDVYLVRFLYQFVLVWLPLVATAAVIFGFLHAESLGHWPKAMFVLGSFVALPLVNDWWHFAPLSYVALAMVGVWQVSVHLWARHRTAALISGGIIAVMLARAALDHAGPAGFDARFGVGIPVRWERWLRAGIFLLPLGLVTLWVVRCFRRGANGSRAPMAALLDADPRCLTYFQLSVAATRSLIDPDARGEATSARLPSCAPGELGEKSSFPKDQPTLWDRLCVRAVLAMKGRLRLLRPLRYLRPPVTEPGHPSVLLHAMLHEGAVHEANYARKALFGEEAGTLFDYLAALPPEEELRTQSDANRHFFRHVRFREALIDAKHLLFLKVPVLQPDQWTAKAKEAYDRFVRRGAPPPAGAKAPDAVASHLQSASRATLVLWLDVLDWLFFERGERMVRRADDTELPTVNLAQLTCNLITLRHAAREAAATPDSPDVAAADLALWLFVGAQTQPASAPAQFEQYLRALRKYFAAVSVTRKLPPAARIEASLAGAAYALYCLSRGELREAPRWFVADRGKVAEGVPEIAWLARVGGFAKAASALGSFRMNPLGAEEKCRWTLGAFDHIDRAESPAEPGVAPWPAGLRGFHFVLHMQRAGANGARSRP